MTISVIIPVYNTDKYIKYCIESILTQTIKNYELILIDDGSIDERGKICDEYSKRYSNVSFFQQKNKGVSAARNLGIKKATGEYIVFVDSDDRVEPNYLEILLKNMVHGGMSVCRLEKNGVIQTQKRLNTQYLSVAQAQISVFSYDGMQGFPVTKMFDRNLIMKKGIFFDETIGICEDVLFVVQYLKNTYGSIAFTDAILYHYRKTGEGSTNIRYKKGVNLQKRQLTEFNAINSCRNYLIEDPLVEDAWAQRGVKGAVTDLRAMTASGERYVKEYATRIQYIRKNLYRYLKGNIGAKSAKLSAILCAISPKLEYVSWKVINEGIKGL